VKNISVSWLPPISDSAVDKGQQDNKATVATHIVRLACWYPTVKLITGISMHSLKHNDSNRKRFMSDFALFILLYRWHQVLQ